MLHRGIVSLLVGVCACAGTADKQVVPGPDKKTPTTVLVKASPAVGSVKETPSEIMLVVSSDKDMDGDGAPDLVMIGCQHDGDGSCGDFDVKGFVVIGGMRAEFSEPDEYDIPLAKKHIGKRVAVVDIDGAGKRGVLVEQQFMGETAGASYAKYWLFAVVGTAIKPIWETTSEGGVVFRDGGWVSEEGHTCLKSARMGDNGIEKQGLQSYEITTYRYASGKVSKTASVTKQRESDCGAYGRCPFVYAGREDALIGEILTNYIGKAASRAQRLEIARRHVHNGSLRIRIAEEKPDETTFIDDVWLEVNGKRMAPRRCRKPLCGADARFYRLPLGKSVVLTFDNVPTAGRIYLGARGYYDLH